MKINKDFFVKKPLVFFLAAVFILEYAAPFPWPSGVSAQNAPPIQNKNITEYQKQLEQADIKKLHAQNMEQDIKSFKSLIAGRDKKALTAQYQNIQASYQKVLSDLDATKNFLQQINASTVAVQRLEKTKADEQAKIGKALIEIDTTLKKNKISSSDYSKLSKTLDELLPEKQLSTAPENPRPFQATKDGQVIKKKVSALMTNSADSTALTVDKLKLKKNGGQTGISLLENRNQPLGEGPIHAADVPAEYLSEGGEIEFSQSVKDLADGLNKDPLNILNFVKNNIDYVPYYGVKKGADAALIERAANDFDQAALLISLLRYSGYPAKYQRGQIKLSLNQAMNLLGVDDPIVAAQLLSKTHIPYILYTDANDAPLFFILEHTWVGAYITYDYTQGIVQNTNEADKMWVPMEPSLKSIYSSQVEDVVDEMGFNVTNFYEAYLQGTYGSQKPMQAFRAQIENYLTANHPDLVYEDILTKRYRQSEKLEFIPNTLPYEIIENTAEYAQAPESLKHKINFRLTDKIQGTELLNCTTTLAELADKQLAITYAAASPADQQVIDSFGDIYNVVPLSLVHIKPVVKVQGAIKCGGLAGSPEIALGKKQDLTMLFLTPGQINGQIVTLQEDNVQKEVIAGNDEGVAINTDRIALPETRPQQDTQTTEFASSQKLYRTALNYLDRLQQSHNELAQTLGGEFTNAATRAIVFNGIDISYQAGEPYSFTWKGLRIDSSAKVNYFSHFGSDIKKNQTRFMHLFGLEGSLDESSIFEEDYDIEAMSTVKGLRLINQGQIPGRSVIKITSANRSAIDTLNISEALKTKFRTSVDAGNTIFTPNQQFTYQNWTGLVYIDLNPNNGDAGYIIGEGLNGGYTVEQWPDGWGHLWRTHLLPNLTAQIISPTSSQTFTQGNPIPWFAHYESVVAGQLLYGWNEQKDIKTDPLPGDLIIGNNILRSGYGTNQTVPVVIKQGKRLGLLRNEYDSTIFKEAAEFGIDPDLLKSVIHKESISADKPEGKTSGLHFYPEAYRYEPCIDYSWFSGTNATIGLTNEPYSHFTIPGKNLAGDTIPQGDKISSLKTPYRKMVKKGALKADHDLKFDDNDQNLTLTELWKGNNGIQNWSTFCALGESQKNFTVQFLLSGSYGLMQVLYQTAIEYGFNVEKPNRSPDELFIPEVGIHYGAKKLKNCYTIHKNWRTAVRCYNGSITSTSTEEYAKWAYDKYYTSNLYDIIDD